MAGRTSAQRSQWCSLSPYARKLLTSHRPDYLETDECLAHETMDALIAWGGPQQWDATLAVLAEGEAEPYEREKHAYGYVDYAMTLEEVAECLMLEECHSIPLGRERIRQIEYKALRKLRHPSRSRVLREFYEE